LIEQEEAELPLNELEEIEDSSANFEYGTGGRTDLVKLSHGTRFRVADFDRNRDFDLSLRRKSISSSSIEDDTLECGSKS
jgi:hypothetical protein